MVNDLVQARYARLAGVMYLAVLGADIVGVAMTSSVGGSGTFLQVSHRVMESEFLYRVGLCLALAGSLGAIVLALGLYVALRPVDPHLALAALLFRVVEAATGALGVVAGFALLQIRLAANYVAASEVPQLDTLSQLRPVETNTVSAIFFCVGSSLFFWLFARSGYIPRIISVGGLLASLIYLFYWVASLLVPQSAAETTLYASLPILIAELSTSLWLLVVGIRVRRVSDPDLRPSIADVRV